MATEQTVAEISARFREEQDYIRRYSDYVVKKLDLDANRVLKTLATLRTLSGNHCMKKQEKAVLSEIIQRNNFDAAISESLDTLEQLIREERSILRTDFPDVDFDDIVASQPN